MNPLLERLRKVPGLRRIKRSVFDRGALERERQRIAFAEANAFQMHYIPFRETRLRKLTQILGKDWFPGKRVLEVGAGHGHISEYLHNELGAQVTLAEARSEHVAAIRQRLPGFRVIQLDNDRPWRLKESFDLVVHWGLLYHLDNWEVDLICALNHAPLLSLETSVCVSNDPTVQVKLDEVRLYDQAFHGRGTCPSGPMIERLLRDYGCEFTRYDDPELNTSGFSFDWTESESRAIRLGPFAGRALGDEYEIPRRFYLIKR